MPLADAVSLSLLSAMLQIKICVQTTMTTTTTKTISEFNAYATNQFTLTHPLVTRCLIVNVTEGHAQTRRDASLHTQSFVAHVIGYYF